MGTPLYTTDIIPLTSRPTLTVMDDGDYFAILDTSTGKISKILKTLAMEALKISYDNSTSGLTATQVQAALDELVVNLGSSDSAISALGGRLDILEADELTEGSIAYDIKQTSDTLKGVGYTEGTLKTHEDRLDTLEGADTIEGSVLKSIKDNAENATFTPTVASGIESMTIEEAVNELGTDVEALKVADTTLSTELSTVKVKTTENDLAIQAIQRDQNLANQSEAKISVSDYGIVALPKNATGNLKMKREGLTATNLVVNGDFSDGTTGWSATSGSIAMSDSNLRLTTGTFSAIVIQYNTGMAVPSVGAKIYINQLVNYVSGSGTARILSVLRGSTSGTAQIDAKSVVTPITETLYNLSAVVEITSEITGTLVLGFREEGATENSIFDIYPVNMLINLTQTFSSIPTIAQCKNIFPTYFADTKNVPFTGRYRGTDLDGVTTHDLYLTAPEGRSVPSAKDSVEVIDGILVHVQKISNSVAVGSGVAVNVTNYPLAKTGGNFRVELTAGGVQIGVIGTDSTSGAGNLTYELATPITAPIDSDGNIPAGASVLWEPAIPDVGIYTDKFDILDTDHPIASIDKLYKVDFATGVQTLLTDAVVAGDGLSFTSASLTAGDLVNVIYFYSVANPEGLTTVEYLNSNVVVADSANEKYYKYKPVITNGEIASWTLTEVV